MREGISVSEAQAHVLGAARELGPETVAVRDAEGRILADPIDSTRVLPPADCSAMDGYAVRVEDFGDAGPRGSASERAEPSSETRLRVVFEVPAGAQASRALRPGEAARIFTGAPVPDGADAVVMQEDTEVEGDAVVIRGRPRAGDHIRRAGFGCSRRRRSVGAESDSTKGAARPRLCRR